MPQKHEGGSDNAANASGNDAPSTGTRSSPRTTRTKNGTGHRPDRTKEFALTVWIKNRTDIELNRLCSRGQKKLVVNNLLEAAIKVGKSEPYAWYAILDGKFTIVRNDDLPPPAKPASAVAQLATPPDASGRPVSDVLATRQQDTAREFLRDLVTSEEELFHPLSQLVDRYLAVDPISADDELLQRWRFLMRRAPGELERLCGVAVESLPITRLRSDDELPLWAVQLARKALDG